SRPLKSISVTQVPTACRLSTGPPASSRLKPRRPGVRLTLNSRASSSSDSRNPGSYSSRQIRSRIVLYMCSNRCRALLPAGLFRSDLSSIAVVPGPREALLMRLQDGAEEGAGALVLGIGEELLRRALLGDAAVVEEADPV